jgi:hypothetical protein
LVQSEVILSDLNFSGGERLVGFNILSSNFSNTTYFIVGGVLHLLWNENPIAGHNAVPVLTGEFLTVPVATTPIPGTFLLFTSATGVLGALGFARRRFAGSR